jgi:hypothetical protein
VILIKIKYTKKPAIAISKTIKLYLFERVSSSLLLGMSISEVNFERKMVATGKAELITIAQESDIIARR